MYIRVHLWFESSILRHARRRSWRLWYSGKIPLAQNTHVMAHVSGHDEGNRAHGDLVLVRGPHATPRLFIQRAKHRDVSQTDQPQLADQIFQLDFVVMRRQHVVVLIETGQVLLLPARDAERAITKNALAVDQVTDDLANAPLAFTIAERFLMRFNSLEQNIQLVHLRTQHGQNVRLADLIDVALEIRRVLSLRRSIHPKHLPV